MSSRWRRRVRQLSCLVIFASFYALRFGPDVAAASAVSSPIAIGSLDELCEEECGPAVSCDQGCWSYENQSPLFHTICGEYAGGGSEGMCLGECGDYYCNEYNDEDGDTCYEDCGECGNNVCEGPEDLGNCPLDCHSCGDGYCTGPYETCSNCGSDCNPTSATCGGAEPGTPDECEEGEVQNGAGYCCEVELLVEGLDGCLTCESDQQCILVFHSGGYYTGDPPVFHPASIL